MLGQIKFYAIFLSFICSCANAIIFDGVSSLVNKDPNNFKSLVFRQIELNWINAPLEDDLDYIGLYLDNEPSDHYSIPVSVHRLNGQTSGQILTDYYLPQINFSNETSYSNDGLVQSSGTRDIKYESHSGRGDQSISSPSSLIEQCVGYCLAYHSRNKILASNCLKTSPTWMQDSFQYIGSRPLPALMLPGTHNSAAYSKQLDKSTLNMINKYQMNQDEPIFNQLVYGIRHLDLRVGYSKVRQRSERLWIYHDIFRTETSVQEVLDQVKKFLDLTSHEIIIIDFHRFTVGFQNENQSTQRERHSRLIETIFKILGRYIVPSYLGQHAPLSELVSAGKRLIIGYASRATLLGSNEQSFLGLLNSIDKSKEEKQVRDIDAIKQDQEITGDLQSIKIKGRDSEDTGEPDRRMGAKIFNKLKSLKLIGRSFSKRSLNNIRSDRRESESQSKASIEQQTNVNDSEIVESHSNGNSNNNDIEISMAKVALFFPPVRHLWPNKDTMEGLSQYMNDTTCRKYFGELRSMMVELTPTVFGAISDKYDGNRKLAELANRQVTDWIRDRWLHCINIVASDYFLGNDLIQLSIYANKMRTHQSNRIAHEIASSKRCHSFRKIEHLLDKSKIPIQFSYHKPTSISRIDKNEESIPRDLKASTANDIITHTSSDGNRIYLKPLTNGLSAQSMPREKRDSFVDNVSDGISDFVSSFKRILNL